MALRPIHGRAVWARAPARVTSRRIVPWQPASIDAAGRLAEDGGVAGDAGRAARRTAGRARCARPRPPRTRRRRRSRRRRARRRSSASSSSTATPPFMSAAPSPHSTSPSMRARSLPLAGTVSVWPASTSRCVAAELGAGDDVVADPLDRRATARRAAAARASRRCAASSWLTDGMSTSSAVSASRSVTTTATPCSRRMSLRWLRARPARSAG